MMYLENTCDIRRNYRVRNSVIRERCGCRLSERKNTDRNVLKWFGHIERMGEERLVNNVCRVNVDGNTARGRSQRG